MIRSRSAMITMLALASTLASCGRGDGPALYPVHGKVMYKGQPAVGASVIFQGEDGPLMASDSAPVVPTGQVDKEGNFALESGDFGYGAPIGKYKVLIEWRSREGGSAEPEPVPTKKSRSRIVPDKPDGIPDRLKSRFMKPEKAIHVEVKPQENDLQPFDVSS